VIQNDSGLPAARQLELSQSLADQIVQQKQLPKPFPSQPRAPIPSDVLNIKSTAAQHLVETLNQIWAFEPDEGSSSIPWTARQNADGSLADLSTGTRDGASFEASIKKLVPSYQQAVAWMSYFHAGPNKLFCICSPTDSLHLLKSFYTPEAASGQIDVCLITWQLACGALFYPDTDAKIYNSLYKSAQLQTAACIESNRTTLLWVVPTLLLECVYLMNPRPRNCWVILGT
jgi:hypothetical protein